MKKIIYTITAIALGAIIGSTSAMKKPFEKSKPFKLSLSTKEKNRNKINETKKVLLTTLFITMKMKMGLETHAFFLQRINVPLRETYRLGARELLYPKQFNPIFETHDKREITISFTELPLYVLCDALDFIEKTIKQFDILKNETKVIEYALSRSLFAAICVLSSFTCHASLFKTEKKAIEKHKSLFDKKEYDSRKNFNVMNNKQVSQHFHRLLNATKKLLNPLDNVFRGCNRPCKKRRDLVEKIISESFLTINSKSFLKEYEKFTTYKK